ncbi:CHAT domain-containing protein [Streptomyces avermitilis]|uniref:CHAT domain-containing protein n=1 Tax=Streptomyces avermitilis TaxID=33903 RepID=UPI0033B3121E
MGLRPGGSPEQRIERSVRKYLRTGRTDDVSRPELLADAERLLSDADGTPPRSPARQRALRLVGWLYLARTGTLNAAAGQLPGDVDTARLLALVRDADPDRIPPRLWELAVEFGADPDARAAVAFMFLESTLERGDDPLALLVALERAASDLQADHPRFLWYRMTLASLWLQHFETSADPGDLDRAEQWGRTALGLCTAGGQERVLVLHALTATLTRQLERQDTADNARAAVEMCRKFLAVAPPGGAEHLGVRFSLGTVLLSRFRHTQWSSDLDEAVDVLREAVSDARRTDGLNCDRLTSLGTALYGRYVRERAQEDLAEAIGVLKEATLLAASLRSPSAGMLSADVLTLEQERAAGRGVPRACLPPPAPTTPHSRAEEARALIDRSEADGDALALDRGIELLGPALRELPEDFADRSAYSAYLGSALLRRHRTGGRDPADLDAAEALVRRAVRSCPEDNSNQVPFRILLAQTAEARYEISPTPQHLDAAIDRWRELLSRPLPVSRHRRQTLNQLGMHLVRRFEQSGSLPDLDEGVQAFRQCLEAAGAIEGAVGTSALNLAGALIKRQAHSDTAHDLDEARECLLAALHHLPDGSTEHDRATKLLDIVTRRQGEARTRHEPFPRNSEFVAGPRDRPTLSPEEAGRAPDSDASAAMYHNVLVDLMQTFERTGDAAALDEGVDIARRLLAAMARTHPQRTRISADLGAALLHRFEHAGDHHDLDAAIKHLHHGAYGPDSVVQQLRNTLNRQDATVEELRQATGGQLDAMLARGDDRGDELANLAGARIRRFQRDGARDDLEEAVEAARRAVEATASDRTVELRHRLHTLGTVLVVRHRHTGNRTDLDQAIRFGYEVLELGRNITGSAQRNDEIARGALGTLCNRLRTRYQLTGSVDDLDKAVEAGREAVGAPQSDGRPHDIDLLNLALGLWDRHALRGDPADLDEAIGLAERAADGQLPSSPRSAHVLLSLASMLRDRSAAGGANPRSEDAARCFALCRTATQAPTAPPVVRLDAAVTWGRFAADRAVAGLGDWTEALDGFAAAVGLLPSATWRGLARGDRERLLAPYAHLATEAAACAIACGRLEQAVELLDQGRSVLWGQALDTRADLTELYEAHPETAARLDDVQAGLSGISDSPTGRRDVTEQQRRLAHEWETLLDDIRHRPGFEHFLLPLPFAELSRATAAGPVIIVNVSQYRCDALVVTPGDVRLIPLPGLTADEAQRCTEHYLEALDRLNRPDAPAGPTQQAVLATLEWLWDTVAGPVLESGVASSWQGRRVWWCATGPLTLLPLHAAGYHDPDDERERDAVMERVVSSYMPTLRALLRARRVTAPPDEVRRLLILALGDRPQYAPHLAPLPGARQEAESLRRRFQGRYTLRLDDAATTGQVLELLPGHTCVHFACHAGQNLAAPSEGALYLHDQPLRVTDLARLDLDTPELAVLSACQTAVGGTELPNEAIHLAAALLLGNFRHVVSTLWPVGDDSARRITDEVYRVLGDSKGCIHPNRTAQALHTAVGQARRRDPDRPLMWASHVHFGP